MTRNPARMLKSEVTVLRRQRKYIRKSKQYREAYSIGMKHSRGCFGEPLVDEVQARVRKYEWRHALRGMRVLLRHHPRGLASVLYDGIHLDSGTTDS
jgi:hypothetical protein